MNHAKSRSLLAERLNTVYSDGRAKAGEPAV